MQLPFKPETPGLLVGSGGDRLNRPAYIEADVGKQALRTLGRQPWTIGSERITQSRKWRRAITLKSGDPVGCLSESQPAGTATSGGAAPTDRVKQPLTATHDQLVSHTIGEAETWTKVPVVRTVIVPVIGINDPESALQIAKARHLQRRSHIGIQIAHGIETLGAGKIQVIAQSQVECELVRRFPVILD